MAESSLLSTQPQWFWRQWSRLGVTGVLAGAGLLTIYAEQPGLASCLIIAAIGYSLWFAGANILGIVLWIAAAAMLSVAVWTTSNHDPWNFIPPEILLTFGGFLLCLPAGILFLVASIRNRRRCAANCGGCMFVLFAVLIFWSPGLTLKMYRNVREDEQGGRQTILAVHCLIRDIEAIRMRLGRVPNDEAELVALRGKPMPTHLHYLSRGNPDYAIFGLFGGLWEIPYVYGFGLNSFGPDPLPRLIMDSGL